MAHENVEQSIVAGNAALSMPPVIYRDMPVLTTELLAQAYETEPGRIHSNFSENKERFTEGKHFFRLASGELREFRLCLRNSESQISISPKARVLILWTERGAARHAKILNTDRAWDVFELLEESYFDRTKTVAPVEALPAGTMSPAQQREIQNLVAVKVSLSPTKPRAFAEVWSKVKNKFKVAKYEQIPAEKFDDVVRYIMDMKLSVPALPAGEEKKALPAGKIISDPKAKLFTFDDELGDVYSSIRGCLCDAQDRFKRAAAKLQAEETRPVSWWRVSNVRGDAYMMVRHSFDAFTNDLQILMAAIQVFRGTQATPFVINE